MSDTQDQVNDLPNLPNWQESQAFRERCDEAGLDEDHFFKLFGAWCVLKSTGEERLAELTPYPEEVKTELRTLGFTW